MKNAAMVLVVAGLAATPVQAADWGEVRPGTFIGAQLTIGGKYKGRPSAALTIAPTQNRIYRSGRSSTKIGEGFALNFTAGTKPTLTLAGIRADTALGLQRDRSFESKNELGISRSGWIAIGVGSVALIAGGLYLYADHLADCDEGECD